jgi:hypothetical protein
MPQGHSTSIQPTSPPEANVPAMSPPPKLAKSSSLLTDQPPPVWCSVNTCRLRRHAMSGARYSNHLHAEEAAGSLEALIRDYESRGRRLRVRAGRRTSSKRLPIHHPACLRPARLVNRRCCKQGNRCTASARRLAALTPSSPPPPPPPPPPLPPPPLPPHHHCHLDLPSPHSRLPSWQHPDLAVFFDEALAASGEEVRSLC